MTSPAARSVRFARTVPMARITFLAAALLAGELVGASPLPAQEVGRSFGRNKVQYEKFDFQVLKTAHFRVYFYPSERRAALMAARMAERWYARLEAFFGKGLEERQPLILYAGHPQFEQTNVVGGLIGEGTGGVTEPLKHRIVLPFAGPLGESDHVIGHELVHGFQFDQLGAGTEDRPLWFVEGMAEYLSLGPRDPHTAMWLRDALARDDLPTVAQLSDPKYFPYRFGQAFLAWVAGVYGDSAVAELLRQSRGGVVPALVHVTGTPVDSLSQLWQQAIRRQYGPLREVTSEPDSFGRRIFTKEEAGKMNLGPALSPDGSRIAFLSAKSLFGVELYIADVKSGRIEHQLTETALDPHYSSLEFIHSAGAWDRQGDRFAFAGVSDGEPVLTVVDAESGEVRSEKRFPDLVEIFNPTWAPDGRRIAFSANQGGLLDLYIYDLDDGTLTRLTDDPFAELEPAWSPDGGRIAFATDRFTSDLDHLRFGDFRLAILDLADGTVHPVSALGEGKEIDPKWTPDGGSLYFIGDRGGISNVYRMEISRGRVSQVTDLFTGVSGITAQSPAISVSSQSGALAFGVYQDGGYALYLADAKKRAGFSPRMHGAMETPREAGILPPPPVGGEKRLAWLDEPEAGLPSDTNRSAEPYHPSLSLDAVSQTSIVAGTDQYGSYFGGGATLYWSDMLSRHRLGTMVQLTGGLQDLAAAAAYQNSANRLIWGGGAQRIPLRYSTYDAFRDTVGGQEAVVDQETEHRETHYGLAGTAWYPLSEVLRAEFAAGFRATTFQQVARTEARSITTGETLLDGETTTSPYGNLYQSSVSAGLVYDNSIFGATSPIDGSRFRIAATPVVGTMNYLEVLADLRRYFLPVRPFTLAFRLLHFGRYGTNVNDERIGNLFLGAPGLIHGYPPSSFSGYNCDPYSTDPCPELNRFLGPRIAVANAELRFPVLGLLGVGEGYYGALPLETALFTDAGLAWGPDDKKTKLDERAFFLGGDRRPVYSAGLALRLNVKGLLVIQYDLARAFQRHQWVWELGFMPGF